MSQKKIPHVISLDHAIVLTANFRASRPPEMAVCETLDKESVKKMLHVSGAEKLRIYYGRKANGQITAVLVAADAEGYDILPPIDIMDNDRSDEEAIILDDTVRCPDLCPPPSPLNN